MTVRSDIGAVVLAGGRSSRMGGGDKPLIEINGRPILGRVLERLSPHLSAIAINANGDPGRFDRFGLQVLPDTVDGYQGPLAGILAGLAWAATREGVRSIVTVPGDTPFLPTDLVPRLLAEGAGFDGIVLAASRGRTHPVCGVWPVGLAPKLARYMAEHQSRRVMDFVASNPVRTVDFEPAGDVDPFFNVNTPDDLARAVSLVRGGLA